MIKENKDIIRGGIIMELEVLRKDMVAAMKAKDKVTKEAVSH